MGVLHRVRDSGSPEYAADGKEKTIRRGRTEKKTIRRGRKRKDDPARADEKGKMIRRGRTEKERRSGAGGRKRKDDPAREDAEMTARV